MTVLQATCTECGLPLEHPGPAPGIASCFLESVGSGSILTTQSLREHQRERLAHLDRQLAQIKAYLVKVEAERQAVQNDLNTIVYPVLAIPNELTAKIFIYCLPDHRRVRPLASAAPLLLAQVCRQWRDVALSTGDLWASAAFSFEKGTHTDSNMDRILAAWFPRAAGRPLSLVIRYIKSNVWANFRPIFAFQTQLSRLDLCLPEYGFRELDKLRGGFPRLCRLAISFADSPHDPPNQRFSGVMPAFQGIITLRELCLGKGISLSNFESEISPLLTTLELSEAILFREMLDLVQRFPKLEHLKVCPKSEDRGNPDEVRTILHLRSLDFGCPGDYLDRLTLPNLHSLGLHAEDPSLPSISQSGCTFQRLNVHSFTDPDIGPLFQCLKSTPSLVTLRIEVVHSNDTRRLFRCLAEASVAPHLRTLEICIPGPINYESLLLMLLSSHRHTAALRSLRLQLDCYRYVESTSFRNWLPNSAFRGTLESLGLEIHIETPDEFLFLQRGRSPD
ncbi:hypothetical protein C8R44DRAFT_752683 [Mycena epipterygia]|nr:hypothetical protein C8R44DRAFT_752683 [Mycena epipterygia]